MKPYFENKGIVIYNADWRSCHLHEHGQFDILLTDPPYGIRESAGKNASRNKPFGSNHKSQNSVIYAKDYGKLDWDDETPCESDIQWMRSLAKHQIIWGGNYFQLPPSRCWLVWDKVNSGDFADCELAWTNLDKAVRLYKYMWNGMLKENPEKRFHATAKPLALFQWCINQAGSGVTSLVDPYLGSGTSLVAAKLAGITAVGCDREESFCETAARRLEQEVFDFAPLPTLPESALRFQDEVSSSLHFAPEK